MEHTALDARKVAEEAMKIAAQICIYTNNEISIEEL
jgi:ATP-dependent HslUV protease subunit HslV